MKRILKIKKELIIKIFSLLPDKFLNIKKQLDEGILIGLNKKESKYVKFALRTDILKKYEDKFGNYFAIRGIKVFDKILENYTEVDLDIAYGIFLGYSTSLTKELVPDISKIDTTGYWVKHYENREFEKIKKHLKKEELNLINPNDVYEVELNGRVYYHLKDIDDGNFIGMDETGKLFKISHDPFEITNTDSTFLK